MTVRRAFLEWPERGRPNKQTGADCRVSRRETGQECGFQPMKTRQVGGMALVNPLKAWRLKGGVGKPFCAASFQSRSETRQNH